MKRIFIFTLLLPAYCFAQSISGISIEPTTGNVGEPVNVKVNVSSPSKIFCGVRISFGDGSVEDKRIDSDEFIATHSYQSTGTFAIIVEGRLLFRGLKTAAACHGSTQKASIIIIDPSAEKGKAIAAQNELKRKAELEEKERALREKEQQLKSREEAMERKLLDDREKILKAREEEKERAFREKEQQLKSREEAMERKLLDDREKILKAREEEIMRKEKEALMNSSPKDSPPEKQKVLNPLNAF